MNKCILKLKFFVGPLVINDLSATTALQTRRRRPVIRARSVQSTKRPLVEQYADATIAICATSDHARSLPIGRNKTRPLSLMSGFQVNVGTSHRAACVDQR
jgi:hypothetical protein